MITPADPGGLRGRGLGIVIRMSGHRDRWLLLHGTPLTPEVWDGVAAYLGEYGPIWSPDASPGAGSPDAPAALAGHLAAAVESSPDRLHVAGHSYGGQVAIDFAVLAPQRVQTLTLICTPGHAIPCPRRPPATGDLAHPARRRA